jgi:phosphoribosylformylglycinamidine synthase
VTTTAQHLTHFEGGNALPSFRAQALLPRLQTVNPRITGIAARHVHWVASEVALARDQTDKLGALLRYGEPYTGPADGALIVVAPRLGTVSPWASKATDIAHNCGLAIKRVERVTEYRLALKGGLFGGGKPLAAGELSAIATLLHDRMTESVLASREEAVHLFDVQSAEPMQHVDVIGHGRAALV